MGAKPLTIPTYLAASVAKWGDDRRRTRLARLPTIVEELADRWSLSVGVHEARALQERGGDAAVLLYDPTDDEDTLALLLEACEPGTQLRGQPEEKQDEIVAGLLRRLWREPAARHPFRPLQEMCDQWGL